MKIEKVLQRAISSNMPRVIALLMALAVAATSAHSSNIATKDGNKDAEVVTTRIASHTFKIPKSFLWGPILRESKQRPDGQRGGANLEVLLPDLEPRSPRNEAEFRVRGNGNTVGVLVADNFEGRFSSRKTLALYKKNALGAVRRDSNGFDVYTIKAVTFNKELFVKKEAGEESFFLYCSPPGSQFSPGCSGVIDYDKDVYIRFHFSRQFLDQGEKISEKILALIRSFEAQADK